MATSHWRASRARSAREIGLGRPAARLKRNMTEAFTAAGIGGPYRSPDMAAQKGAIPRGNYDTRLGQGKAPPCRGELPSPAQRIARPVQYPMRREIPRGWLTGWSLAGASTEPVLRAANKD